MGWERASPRRRVLLGSVVAGCGHFDPPRHRFAVRRRLAVLFYSWVPNVRGNWFVSYLFHALPPGPPFVGRGHTRISTAGTHAHTWQGHRWYEPHNCYARFKFSALPCPFVYSLSRCGVFDREMFIRSNDAHTRDTPCYKSQMMHTHATHTQCMVQVSNDAHTVDTHTQCIHGRGTSLE